MYQRIVLCLFILIGLSVYAQDIDIHGKVTNLAGEAVEGAIVELVTAGIKDTTEADGSYVVSNATGTIIQSLLPQTEKIALVRGVLKLSLNKPSPVNIQIIDINGNLLKKEVYPNCPAGYHNLNIAEYSRASKLLIVHASVGKQKKTFRYLPLHCGRYAPTTSIKTSTPVGGKLAKIAADIDDMLKITADSYAERAIPVTSYDQELNITLFDEGAVMVLLDSTRQVIDGWGINNNWKALGGSGMNACFDSVNGLGLNILRIGMNENGGVASGAGDIGPARDRGAKIIGSTWSPPGSWKSDGTVNNGGHLNRDRYDAWADRIANFAKNNNLYSMSLGNEPDFASCGSAEPCNGNYPTTLYTAEEMVEFIKVLGPKMRSIAPDCKIMAPEASEWIHTWSDTSGCCSVPGNKPSSDPLKCGCFQEKTTPCSCEPGKGYSYGKYLYEDKEAWAYIDILGVHQYDTQRAEPWPDYVAVEDRRPVWQTEMSGVKWWPDGSPDTGIENGLSVAGWIHDALTVGELNAWCYWWYNGGGNTNEGLLLNGRDTKRHYTFGNYTRYVRPGMTRVLTTEDAPENVFLTAFIGTANKVVIVAINKGSEATVPIGIVGGDGTPPTSMMPIVTSGSENWAEKTPVTISDGYFTATLGEKTITTFVSR